MVRPRLINAVFLVLLATSWGWGLGPSSQASDPPKQAVEPPVKISFRLLEKSGIVRGTVTAWDAEGIEGSFGRHTWDELDLASLRRVYQRLMERKDAEDWILLGELQLRRPDNAADRYAEMAFSRAESLDNNCMPKIELARGRVKEFERQRAEKELIRTAEQLREGMPEGVTWSASPWPALSDAEQKAAIQTMRQASDELLAKAGFPNASPIETKYFLVYSDLPERETVQLVRDLDQMYERVAELLDLPGPPSKRRASDPDDSTEWLNLFWGKATIIICKDADQFRLIEAQAFNQMTPPGVVGLCHCIGPRVFVNTYRAPDDLQFASVLVHETVHGIMHRFITPARLPTWANEGFAEYIASKAFPGSPVDKNRRPQGLAYIRQSGDLQRIMDMSYQNGTWPGHQGVGYAVGYLLCDLMIREHPRGFVDWIRAVKAGKPWREALEAHFGAHPDKLAGVAYEWYSNND